MTGKADTGGDRFAVARSTGIEVNAWATLVPGGYVSTLYRRSSALVSTPLWYFETMAFLDNEPGIAWQSAASHEWEGRRQHDMAVRWFQRRQALPPATALAVASETGSR